MEYLWELFTVSHLFFLFFGLFIGIIVGAMPGLTPTMGVALTIPFTFSMGPTEGLIILGGIYCGSVYGGSIPAILFNVPGAPASVATTFDGYPMTKKGEGRKALELTTIASVIGGIFGMVLLVFFAPVFADLSLQFGPAESFWIAVFGITVIAAISEGAITKNLIGGCLGIFLSFIGIHTVTGMARFTFGSESLISGFHIVAVLIGLFAFPQALRLIEMLPLSNKTNRYQYKMNKSTVKQSFADVLKNPKSVTIGSVLGALIGLVPGAGGNIASILAYNEVKRFSKNKQDFGKGEKQGVIAAESANNAMVGGSLIPLLTLGIPGSPTAAIFLGGLLIHGIWPGRNLFIDHADVAYTFLYSMVAAQFFLLILGLSLIKYVTKLSHIPSYTMAPVILSFSIIGAYTTQNSVFDVYTVIIIGLVMYVLQKFHFSPAPIALGFILGGIAEEGLLQGMMVGAAQGSTWRFFFTGGWNVMLYSLILLTVIFSTLQAMKQKRDKVPGKAFALSRLLTRQCIVWWLAALGIAVSLLFIQSLPVEQRIFPQITLFSLLFLIILEMGKQLYGKQAEQKQWAQLLPVVPVMLIATIISLGLEWIGFYLQVFLLMILIPLLARRRNWCHVSAVSMLVTSVCFTAVLYLIFSFLVKVPLPVPYFFQ